MNRRGLAAGGLWFAAFCAVPACLSAGAAGESVKLPVIADVGICAHPQEVALNTGASARVRVKGIEHYYLFNFDAGPIRTWQVARATLHLKLAQGHLRRAAFCTVPVAWVEGTGKGQPQNGSTCYTHVEYPRQPWTAWGGTMLDATFNNPHMRWAPADVKTGKDGWMEIPIAPELVQAVAAGLSHGLAMAEEKGQTRENHDVFTREQASAQPYVVVEGQAIHVAGTSALERPAPKVQPFPEAASFDSGAIRIDTSWMPAGGRLLGSRIRVDINQAMELLGRQVPQTVVTLGDPAVVIAGLVPDKEYLVRVESFTGAQGFIYPKPPQSLVVKASPAFLAPVVPEFKPPDSTKRQVNGNGWTAELHPAAAKIAPDARPLAQDKGWPVPITARNAWVGLQAVVFPPEGRTDGLQVTLTPLHALAPQLHEARPPLNCVRLFRAWYVPDEKGAYHAEALVPLKPGETFSIPWKENMVPSQSCQAVFIDVWVPGDAAPGRYEGKLAVSQNGKSAVESPIVIDVSNAALADEFRIVGDMNTYDSPARAMGVKTSDPAAFIETERKYYRLAHAHRMTLNVLPYSQAGEINWRGAPRLAGTGADTRITDWSEWDQRYGPLLSGEAFSAKAGCVGPGEGTPVHHMYMPFHENWPARLADHFKPWPPPKDYDAFLKWSADLPPIERCFDPEPPSRVWQHALNEFARHITQKGWLKTEYQVYLNDKHYFRDTKTSGGRGVSLWLLDEPMFADDFLALGFFGRIVRNGPGIRRSVPVPGLSNIKFRIDISRPTHQRNWLDGLVDLNVCADQLYSQRRLIEYRKLKFGEEYWNYRMPPSFERPAASEVEPDNVGWAAWPVESYCWGATGTLPWQTVASDGDFDKADATALMYPPQRFGLSEPLPSLRMKAWRDGLQDAELLRRLREKMEWNDLQLRAFVGQVCGLEGWRGGADPGPDAPIVTFRGIDSAGLGALRRAAISLLQEK